MGMPSENLARWYMTSKGNYVHDRRYDLLRALTACWSRRNTMLLQIGCGDGRLLYRLWEDGYAVTAIDDSQPLLDTAASTLEGRADFMTGKADCLPFDNDAFDYVVLPVSFELLPDPESVLSEALRVAAHGIAFLFPNTLSFLPRYASSLHYPEDCQRFISPSKAVSLARSLTGADRVECRTMLPTPPWLWTKAALGINIMPLPVPFGCCAGVRIDKGIGTPVTPIILKGGLFQKQAAQAVEEGGS